MPNDTEALNFLVSAELKERLRSYASDHGITISGAVRLLLTQTLDRIAAGAARCERCPVPTTTKCPNVEP